MSAENIFPRLAVLAELADRYRVRSSTLGRTAIMKLLFFLQESRGVSLGYNFSLYSYGPFDADVLSDVGTAVRLNVLSESTVYYTSGSGYEYRPGTDVASIKTMAARFLQQNINQIDWVVATFGSKNAGELELLSTTLFVAKYQNPKSFDDLTSQVQFIKPHFTALQIKNGIQELIGLEVLRQAPAQNPATVG